MQRPVSWSMSVIPGLGQLGQEDSKLGTAGLHGEILSDEGLEIQLSGESTLPHEREDQGSDPQKQRRSQTL